MGGAVVAVVGFLVVGVVVSYNRFVRQRQLVRDAWANVDTELRRRYDLVPNLVRTVEGYAAHERAALDAVTRARAAAVASHGRPDEQARDENALVASLRQLLAVSESYPQLRASGNFLALQQELTGTEDRIQVARRLYNANVRNLDRRVRAFPSNLVAWAFRFEEEDFFEVDEAVRRAPAVRSVG